MRKILIGVPFEGLLGTGADVSCIAGKDWPNAWPATTSGSTLIGLGMANNIAKSSSILKWQDGNSTGHFQPYIIPSLPFTLWGRDLLEQMGAVLKVPESQESTHEKRNPFLE